MYFLKFGLLPALACMYLNSASKVASLCRGKTIWETYRQNILGRHACELLNMPKTPSLLRCISSQEISMRPRIQHAKWHFPKAHLCSSTLSYTQEGEHRGLLLREPSCAPALKRFCSVLQGQGKNTLLLLDLVSLRLQTKERTRKHALVCLPLRACIHHALCYVAFLISAKDFILCILTAHYVFPTVTCIMLSCDCLFCNSAFLSHIYRGSAWAWAKHLFIADTLMLAEPASLSLNRTPTKLWVLGKYWLGQ